MIIMAKSKGAFLSIEANGKVGSLIAYRNQWGQILREVPDYEDPETEQQLSWRSAVGYLSGKWKTDTTITDPLRYMWRDFGLNWPTTDRFGKQIHLSARDWFIKLNVFRRMAGMGYHKAPPKYPSCSIEPGVTFTQDDEGIFVDVDTALIGDDILWISAVPDQNVSRLFMPRTSTDEWFLKSTTEFPFLLYKNSDLPADNKRIFFKYRPVDGSGRAAPARITSLVAKKGVYSLVIAPSEHCRIIEVDPNNNFNTLQYFNIQSYTNDHIKSLIYPDLSSIPTWASIISGSINLYCHYISDSINAYLHRVNTESYHSQATWYDAYSGLPWSSPGMAYPFDYDELPLDSVLIDSAGGWKTFDCTSYIKDIVSSAKENYGLVFLCIDDGFLRFISPSYSDSKYRPYLSISYS